MIFVNLLFVLLNGFLFMYFFVEKPTSWLCWINLLAFILNAIPVCEKLAA